MSIGNYLSGKYGFADNADMPVSFLQEELHLKDITECKVVVKKFSDLKRVTHFIPFAIFCLVVERYLDMGF